MIGLGNLKHGNKGYKEYGTMEIGEGLWHDSVTVIAVITVITMIRAQMKMGWDF